MHDPVLSILMVARNTAAFVDAALTSARAQSLQNIEIVFVDDGSVDGTREIAQRHANVDSRVRVVSGPQAGLSAVRNASLAEARAPRALVLDSDDMLHPRHCELLLRGQMKSGHQVCAANMVEFTVDGASLRWRPFAEGASWEVDREIGVSEYLETGMIGGQLVSLGYLKPLFDLAFLRRHALQYDERLRIGEDVDLVLRALLAGGRMFFLPQPTYFYRRHSASTSHRLTIADCEGLLEACDSYQAHDVRGTARLIAARRANIASTLRHLRALAAIKHGDLVGALQFIAKDRIARAMTYRSFREALAKRFGRSPDMAGAAWVPIDVSTNIPAMLNGLVGLRQQGSDDPQVPPVPAMAEI